MRKSQWPKIPRACLKVKPLPAKALELDPNNAIAYYNLGRLLAKDTARAGEAEAAYRKAIALEPNNARYVYRLGLLLHDKLNRFAEAESAYRRAIELAPNDPDDPRRWRLRHRCAPCSAPPSIGMASRRSTPF